MDTSHRVHIPYTLLIIEEFKKFILEYPEGVTALAEDFGWAKSSAHRFIKREHDVSQFGVITAKRIIKYLADKSPGSIPFTEADYVDLRRLSKLLIRRERERGYYKDPEFRAKTLKRQSEEDRHKDWYKEAQKRRVEKNQSAEYKDYKNKYDLKRYYGEEWGELKYLNNKLKEKLNDED